MLQGIASSPKCLNSKTFVRHRGKGIDLKFTFRFEGVRSQGHEPPGALTHIDSTTETMTSQNFLYAYHGGRRWEGGGGEIRPCRPGRYECGPGIYLTNAYATAQKYAKGGGVVQMVAIPADINWLEDALISLAEAEAFVSGRARMKNRDRVIEDLRRVADRRPAADGMLPAEVLRNLSVNHDSLGADHGPALAAWFADRGIQASLNRQNGQEDWLVIFEPRIMVASVLQPGDVDHSNPDLPPIREQLADIRRPIARPRP